MPVQQTIARRQTNSGDRVCRDVDGREPCQAWSQQCFEAGAGAPGVL